MAVVLPTDIYLLILGHLDVKDILNVRKSSRYFHELSNSRSVWDAILYRDIIVEDVPIPGLRVAGQSVDDLSREQLERCYRSASALRRNWLSGSPTMTRSLRLEGLPNTRLVGLHVLPGLEGRRWLVSLAMTYGQQRNFTVRCWDLVESTPVCVAQRNFLRFGGMAVNKIASEAGSLAVLTPHGIEIIHLHPNSVDPSMGFVTSHTIQSPLASIHHFHDKWVAGRDSDGRLFLFDVNRPQVKLEFLHNTMVPIDFIVTDTFVLVLKTTTLELYPLPTHIATVLRHIIIPPIFAFTWPWRVDHAVMTLRHGWPGDLDTTNTPITIFVRFGSMFPWAINLIHHYEIRPNKYFSSSDLPNEMNIPYQFPPTLNETIGSPVRLHATTDLTVGAYGTALWIDSHTEDYYLRSDRGQRLAGTCAKLKRMKRRRMRRPTPSDEDDSDENEDEDEGEDLDDDISESEDEDEPAEPSAQVASTGASSVYSHHESDNWVRLALDEEEGNIFIGRDDGEIEIFQYS